MGTDQSFGRESTDVMNMLLRFGALNFDRSGARWGRVAVSPLGRGKWSLHKMPLWQPCPSPEMWRSGLPST